jgi:hypothetical protein
MKASRKTSGTEHTFSHFVLLNITGLLIFAKKHAFSAEK